VNVPSHPMMPRIEASPNHIEVTVNHLGGIVNVPSHPMMSRIEASQNHIEVTVNHLGGIVNVSSQPICMSPTTIISVSATPAFLVLQLSLILSTLIYQTLHSLHLKTEMKIILDCEAQLIGVIVFRDQSFCIHFIHIKCIKLVTVDILLYCYTFTIYTYSVVLNTILVCVEISAVRIDT
jgi:hypothetical protein